MYLVALEITQKNEDLMQLIELEFNGFQRMFFNK